MKSLAGAAHLLNDDAAVSLVRCMRMEISLDFHRVPMDGDASFTTMSVKLPNVVAVRGLFRASGQMCAILKPPRSPNEWLIRKRGAFAIKREELACAAETTHAITKPGFLWSM